jgi:hypothetical protein
VLLGAFCWIVIEKNDENNGHRDNGYAMRVSLMHGQIWVIYVLNSLFYVRIYKFITSINKDAQSADVSVQAAVVAGRNSRNSSVGSKERSTSTSSENSVEKTVKILQYYPIILIITWCPLIVMRVFEYAGFYIPCWVYAFSLGMTNMQGLCNAVVFFSVSKSIVVAVTVCYFYLVIYRSVYDCILVMTIHLFIYCFCVAVRFCPPVLEPMLR